ncbi:DUF3102 domain-containing protein [Magnetofaba australis]|uniref:DUF3102 domain-containing protein n=1 Tax=Magnetofaba australis IT-1 TaxID=1434232 RepID=A0A1Y2K4X4_9PROT|nr:DUF3102 domain-containing protein [Magnetofaba australis]OSM04458.1 hypothetical protein MAIT1_04372 [Magnetofaba australis IT-1]
MSAVTPFNYDSLIEPMIEIAKPAAERIRLRMRRTAEDIIAIGQDLQRVKDAIPHGSFGPWIQAEFEMTESSALRFMRVAERFGTKSVNLTDLKPSVLYFLAAPSTPEEVIEKAVEKSSAGDSVSNADVKKWKEEIRELKQQSRKKQEDFKAEVATLKLDLKNRSNRNAELTRELQDVRRECNDLRNQASAQTARAEVVIDAEPVTVHEHAPMLPRETLFTLLGELESAIKPIHAMLHVADLQPIHDRLRKTLAIVEVAMSSADNNLMQRSQ